MKTHLVIPDTQIRPGISVNHLNALGNYIVHTKPDNIIMLGDWCDVHSLSSYDVGRLAGEGARYEEDIEASKGAMSILFEPINQWNERKRRNKERQYKPDLLMLLGNHENRINRHVNNYPVLQGRLSTEDLGYESFGWRVLDFLEVEEVDGILYSHYFPRNAQGRIVQTHHGCTNAAMQVQREGQSCTSGHLQGLSWHVQQRRDRRDYGLIAGSFYMHEEDYLSPQGTAYWRGVIMKHQVDDGEYDPCFVSLDYLLRRHWDGEERRV